MNIVTPIWRFVPESLDAADISALETLFTSLLDRPILTVSELERWLEDESELYSKITAEKARRYIAKTCHTDDEQARDRFLTMERDVMPRVQVLGDTLDSKLLGSEFVDELPTERYEVAIRSRRSAKEIFREANTVLQAFSTNEPGYAPASNAR